MHPDNRLMPGSSLFKFLENIFPPLHPFFCLGIEQGRYWHYAFEKKQKNIVEKNTQQIDFISPVPDWQK